MSAIGKRVLLVIEHSLDSAPIMAALPAEAAVETVELVGSLDGERAQSVDDADLVIVSCDRRLERALEAIASAARRRPERPVVVLYTGSPNGFMEQAFAAGADDLITLPLPASQLAFALEKAVARRRGTQSESAAGAMITVLGPKGGTGKTLTACNLAVALAQRRRSVVVVDLDLQFGDVGLALGLRPKHTIHDLAVAGGSLDAEKVESFLATHDSGARALLAPLRPDQATAVGSAFLRGVLEILRGQFEFVVVDTPPAFTPEVIAAIDSASDLCMVGTLDALSLKDTKIGLETLAQMGHDDPNELRLVLNRADTNVNVGIAPSDVERILGRRPDVLVPSDRAIPRAITDGKTIVAAEPRSGAARAFGALADTFLAPPTPAPSIDGKPSQRRWTLRKAVA